MPRTSTGRREKSLYQPPLPGTADPGLDVGRGPRRPAPRAGQGWHLDEKTRKAGRQGVAAARAALAGAAGPDGGRRADAA